MWDGSVGATLKAPFVQTPGGTLSGPPGNIHMAGICSFFLSSPPPRSRQHSPPDTTYVSRNVPLLPLLSSFLLGTHCCGPRDRRAGTQHYTLEPKSSGRETDGSRRNME